MLQREYHWLAFDCEAVAVGDAAEYLEPVTAPSNWKDPVKIEAYIADGTKKALAGAALDVDLARIVAIAWQSEAMERAIVALSNDLDEERAALTRFWEQVRSLGQTMPVALVGFCIRTYDLPLLVRRSQLLGVPYPDINMDRYRSTQMVDLYDRLTFNGVVDGKKLATYCKRFGVVVDDSATGADIAELVASGQWGLVAQHAGGDVQRVIGLARAIGAIHVPSTEPAEVI
jgi:hypothetical protein